MTLLIDHFLAVVFRSAIDQALDDQTPPRGWTAWALRHSVTLYSYYETMLAMELDLRFPSDDIGCAVTDSPLLTLHRPRRETISALSLRIAGFSAIAALLIVGFVVGLATTRSPVTPSAPSIPLDLATVTPASSAANSLDNAHAVHEHEEGLASWDSLWSAEFLTFPSLGVAELVDAWVSPCALPSLVFPIDSVVDFASAPIARTLTFLEIAGIVRSDRDQYADPDI